MNKNYLCKNLGGGGGGGGVKRRKVFAQRGCIIENLRILYSKPKCTKQYVSIPRLSYTLHESSSAISLVTI